MIKSQIGSGLLIKIFSVLIIIKVSQKTHKISNIEKHSKKFKDALKDYKL